MSTIVKLSTVVRAQTGLDSDVTSQTGGPQRNVTSSPFGDAIAALRRRHLNQSNDVITPHDVDVITAVPTRRMSDAENSDDSEAADDSDSDDDDVHSPTEQRLMRNLLRRYETAVRPVHNASDTVMVRMGLTLTQIFNMVSRSHLSAY